MSTQDTAAPRGFTLIELLVALGILGLLCGLISSAVMKVRAAASRTECQNRMRQLGIALHQFHDQKHVFPAGTRSFRNRDRKPFTGWPLDILPFIDQASLQEASAREFITHPNPLRPRVHASLSAVVPMFLCPDDHRILTPFTTPKGSSVAFTSYLGSVGKNGRSYDGVLYEDSRVRMIQITDGLSCTLIVGERPPSHDLQFGWWYAGTGSMVGGLGDMILGVRTPNLPPFLAGEPCGVGVYEYGSATGFDDPCGRFHFWSPHLGGANFLFADGAVRFLPYSANGLMVELASIAGGESTQAPD